MLRIHHWISVNPYKALRVAIEIASRFKEEIVLLNVIPAFPGIPADTGYAFAGAGRIRASSEGERRKASCDCGTAYPLGAKIAD